MPQTLQPCCSNASFEMVDAPRTEGAISPTDVICCSSCGSAISSKNIDLGRRHNELSKIVELAGKIGLSSRHVSQNSH